MFGCLAADSRSEVWAGWQRGFRYCVCQALISSCVRQKPNWVRASVSLADNCYFYMLTVTMGWDFYFRYKKIIWGLRQINKICKCHHVKEHSKKSAPFVPTISPRSQKSWSLQIMSRSAATRKQNFTESISSVVPSAIPDHPLACRNGHYETPEATYLSRVSNHRKRRGLQSVWPWTFSRTVVTRTLRGEILITTFAWCPCLNPQSRLWSSLSKVHNPKTRIKEASTAFVNRQAVRIQPNCN